MDEYHVYIIIPVYNRDNLISPCIESVIEQTHSLWTAVIVDDGSTDGTASILDDFAARDNRVKVIHQENSGIAGARNRGLDEVFLLKNQIHAEKSDEGQCEETKDFIMFLDSDDILEPYAMEYAINAADKHDADIVQWQAHDFVSDDENPEHIINRERNAHNDDVAEIVVDSKGALETLLDTKGKGADKRFHLLWNDCRCVWTKMCALKVYAGVRCPKDKSYEDDFIVDELFMNAAKIVFVNENLTNYRCHGGNFLKTIKLKDSLDHTECERNRFTHAVQYKDARLTRLAFHNVLISTANSYKKSWELKTPCGRIWKELKKICRGYENDFDKTDMAIYKGFMIAPVIMNLIYNKYRKMKEQ